jgi:hypothetical protein
VPDATETFAITQPTVALSEVFFAEAMLISNVAELDNLHCNDFKGAGWQQLQVPPAASTKEALNAPA